MKNIFRKTATVILAALTVFSFTVSAAAAGNDGTTAKAIRFGEDGKLRIMHVTDTHLSDENLDDSVWLIAEACDREQPDVVLLTGDIAMADTVELTLYKTERLMSVFEERHIPTAVCFGNHDSEKKVISREELMAYYNSFSCSISVDDGDILPWCGTYNIPVLAHDSDEMKFNIWMFDSGDYDGEGHYSNVSEEQVKWYTEKSKAIEEENGQKIYSLAFQHIIVPEIYDALKESKLWGGYKYGHIYDKTRYFSFDPANENHGFLHEYPCPGYYNHGQFDAMIERGDVLGIFSGHDHTNSFRINYKGIDIGNTPSTRYNGETFSTQYGYRMMTVDENDPSTYTTRVQQWYDFFSLSDTIALSSGNTNARLAFKVFMLGWLQKTAQKVGVFITQLFSGRTVRYPD